MRLRIALVAAVMAVGTVGVPAASAANGTSVPPKVTSFPALFTMPMQGTAKNGKQFKGTYAVQRFVAGKDGKTAYAVGTLKGKLKGRTVTRYGVRMPATLTGGAATRQILPPGPNTCPILHLEIGAIDINLLGLRVRLGGGESMTQDIVLDLTAYRNQGLLGDLLCGVSNLLNQGGLLGDLASNVQQLAATLNSIASLLNGAVLNPTPAVR